jgi:hypothetical protein
MDAVYKEIAQFLKWKASRLSLVKAISDTIAGLSNTNQKMPK